MDSLTYSVSLNQMAFSGDNSEHSLEVGSQVTKGDPFGEKNEDPDGESKSEDEDTQIPWYAMSSADLKDLRRQVDGMHVSEEDSSEGPQPDESEEGSDSEVEPELGPRDAYTETLSLKMGGSGRGHVDYGFGLSFDQSIFDGLSQNAEAGTDSSGSEGAFDDSEDSPAEDDDSESDDSTAPDVSADQITDALDLTFHLNTSRKDQSNSSVSARKRSGEKKVSGTVLGFSMSRPKVPTKTG